MQIISITSIKKKIIIIIISITGLESVGDVESSSKGKRVISPPSVQTWREIEMRIGMAHERIVFWAFLMHVRVHANNQIRGGREINK